MPDLAPLRVLLTGEDRYSKQFNKMVRSAKKVGQVVSNAGRAMTTALTLPILGVGAASLKMSRELNKAMANVGTLIPTRTEDLKRFKGQVQDLAVQTGTASTVIAEGLYETISAFGDAEDPINKLTIATKMSKAGLSTVKEALSLVSATTKGYGDTSDGAAQKVSDLAFLTVKLGQTTFPDLAASMGRVIPLASTLKVSQEELFGAMATLTGVTGNAAEVSTQLRSALGAFIKPSSDMTKASKKMGYESSIAMLKELGLGESLKKLGEYAGGSEIKLGKMLTRKEGLNAALALLGPQAENFKNKTLAMGKAAGSTDAAFKAQTEGIDKAGFTWDQMIERLKKVAVQIGDRLLPIISRLLGKIEPMVNAFANASDESLDFGIKIAGVVAAIGPALMIIGKLISLVSAAAGAIGSAGGLAGILAALTGPVGIAIAAIAALIAFVAYFWDQLEGLRNAIVGPFIDTFNNLKDLFTGTSTGVWGLLDALKPLVQFMADLIAPVVKLGLKLALLPFDGIIMAIKVAISVIRVIVNAITVMIKAVQFAFLWLKNLIVGWLESTAAGRMFLKILGWISSGIGNVWGFIKEMWNTLIGFFDWIADKLEMVGIEFDKKIEEQKKIGEGRPEELAPAPIEGTYDPELLAALEGKEAASKEEQQFTFNFEGLPEGASVSTPKKSKAKIKENGAVMQGAL